MCGASRAGGRLPPDGGVARHGAQVHGGRPGGAGGNLPKGRHLPGPLRRGLRGRRAAQAEVSEGRRLERILREVRRRLVPEVGGENQ